MNAVLFADDDPAMRAMVADLLGAAGFEVRLVPDGQSALEAVRRAPPDLVILDYRMGALTGFDVCRALKANPRLEHIPVLILTAQGSTDKRVEGFEEGADDFLPKPFEPRELVARCRALLRLARQGLDRNPTTGLPGGDALRREFDRRADLGDPFCVCYLDLDHFKPFNDRFGFALADEVIRAAGDAVSAAAAAHDGFAGHIGGDDYVLFAPPPAARPLVEEAQARFRDRLPALLPAEVAAEGHFRAEGRDGELRDFPLTRLSGAIVCLDPSRVRSLSDFGEAIARAKLLAKRHETGIAEIQLRDRVG